MSAVDETAFPWRLRSVERRVDNLDKEKADQSDVDSIIKELASLRRTLTGFLVTVAASSVIYVTTQIAIHVK